MITQDPDFPGYDNDGGDPFDADFLLRRAEERPNDWKRWLRLGFLLADRGPTDPLPALRRAVALAPENGLAHYLLGRSLLVTKLQASAEREFEIAVMLRPDLVEAWRFLAVCRFDDDRFAEAIEACLVVIRLEPDDEAYYFMAKCFIRQRRYAEAIVALEEAVRLKPNHTVAHRALVCLANFTNDVELERRHLQTLFTLDEGMARMLEDDLELAAQGKGLASDALASRVRRPR